MSNKFNLKHNPKANQEQFPFTLPSLPYDKNALEPYISSKTLDFHHGKHHQTYVTKLNELIENTDLSEKNLEEIIYESFNNKIAVFNNAAQIWNHSFYWHCMKQNGGGLPNGEIAALIEESFESFENFKKEFTQAGLTQFGSGWAWLVLDENNKLKITKSGNADLPIVQGHKPLLTVDVWEHAYYLDYQNKRPDYVTVFLENLVNWDFVNYNLALYRS